MHTSDTRKVVYLIGSHSQNVGKSYNWNFESIPNVSGHDILIIDITTLTIDVLKNNMDKYYNKRCINQNKSIQN